MNIFHQKFPKKMPRKSVGNFREISQWVSTKKSAVGQFVSPGPCQRKVQNLAPAKARCAGHRGGMRMEPVASWGARSDGF